VVPLVFKTSLGAVRFPEGSTPSLLRHKNTDKLNAYNLRCDLAHRSPNSHEKGPNHDNSLPLFFSVTIVS